MGSTYVDARAAVIEQAEPTIDDDFTSAFVSTAMLADCEMDTAQYAWSRRAASLAVGLIAVMGCGLALSMRRSSIGAKQSPSYGVSKQCILHSLAQSDGTRDVHRQLSLILSWVRPRCNPPRCSILRREVHWILVLPSMHLDRRSCSQRSISLNTAQPCRRDGGQQQVPS